MDHSYRPTTSTAVSTSGGFAPYPGFGGGQFVDGGDLSSSCGGEIATGADAGGASAVRAWCCSSGGMIGAFDAWAGFTGGVRVAVGNHDSDTYQEMVVGAGIGGSPDVKVFNLDGTYIAWFQPFEPTFTGGVYVASGQVDGSGYADLVAGKGVGDFPKVRVYNGSFGLIREFLAW